VANASRRGLGKPETFTFLGFTFICSRTRRGKFQIKRKSRRDRMRVKLQAIKQDCDGANASADSPAGKMAAQVVTGYFNYHAVPTNSSTLTASYSRYQSLAAHATAAEPERLDNLGSGSSGGRRLAPETANPSSVARESLRVRHPRWEPYARIGARTDLCGGREVTRVPTAKAAAGASKPTRNDPVRTSAEEIS